MNEEFKEIQNMLDLSDNELRILLINLYESFAFNQYLYKDYYNDYKLNFYDRNYINNILVKRIKKLKIKFDKYNIDFAGFKYLLESAPMILLLDDLDKMAFIYRDNEIQGLVIKDNDGKKHTYRINKKSNRNIVENKLFYDYLDEDNIVSDKIYKKSYYIKK